MRPDPRAVTRRDAGLRRVSRLTRWLLAGSLALTGMFAALAARAFPGQGGQRNGGAVTSRGACRLPDGAVRLLRSALEVFAGDLRCHLRHGPCPGAGRPSSLPAPRAGGPAWR